MNDIKSKDTFSEYHPLVNFLFFAVIFTFSMFGMHPVCLAISFVTAVGYYIKLKGKGGVRFILRGVIPLLVVTSIINPAFSHAGVTLICYLPSGNPLTLESILYGIAAGFMLTSVILWFACFSEVVTSDKFVYLFGRIIPSLSLLLSMTLRFVPRFIAEFREACEVQAALGRDIKGGGFVKRMKNAVAAFSAVVTLSLENAVETSDSMKSRGYGTAKRTAYSTYLFTERDKTALVFIGFCALFLLAGKVSGGLYWRFYPNIRGALADPLTLALQAVYAALGFMPLFIDIREERMWKRLKSSI